MAKTEHRAVIRRFTTGEYVDTRPWRKQLGRAKSDLLDCMADAEKFALTDVETVIEQQDVA